MKTTDDRGRVRTEVWTYNAQGDPKSHRLLGRAPVSWTWAYEGLGMPKTMRYRAPSDSLVLTHSYTITDDRVGTIDTRNSRGKAWTTSVTYEEDGSYTTRSDTSSNSYTADGLHTRSCGGSSCTMLWYTVHGHLAGRRQQMGPDHNVTSIESTADEHGRLESQTDGGVHREFTYNERGDVTRVVSTLAGDPYETKRIGYVYR